MAGRQSGNIGLILTTIFFAFATIISIVVAVMLGNKIEEHRKASESAQQTLNKFITSAERGQPRSGELQAEAEKAEAGRSVFTHLVTTSDRIKRNLAGSETLSPTEIDAKMKEAGIAEGQDALSYIKSLSEQLKVAQENLAKQDALIKTEQEKFKTVSASLDSQKTNAEADSKKIADTLAAIEQEAVSVRAKNTELQGELQKKLDESGQANSGELVKLIEENASLDKKIKDLQLELNRLKGELKRETPTVPDPAEQVDGQIIAMVTNDPNTLYINLGRRDHLVLGLTFEVYDALRGVEVEEVEDKDGEIQLKRGKATIEVVSMTDTSAMCRVVRSSFGRPILVQDPIANLVYDKQRKFTFYVVGDFDLDGDGKATLSDREQVIDLVERWGGIVVKAEDRKRRLGAAIGLDSAEENVLPLDTDFVLLGQEPPLPDVSGEVTDPTEKARLENLKRVYDDYSRIRTEAKALGIPVLNQNRFLALIGYYQQ